MSAPDFSKFGNPFHWSREWDETECWWFIQIEPGLLVRFSPDGEVGMLDAREEHGNIVGPRNQSWHPFSECPE